MTQNNLTVRDRLSSIIKASLPMTLKKYGFRKQGTTYVYKAEKLIYLIKVYKSRYNTDKELDFRLEWGIDINEDCKKPDVPFKAEALYGTHGNLTKGKRGLWFTLKSTDTSETDEAIQQEIKDIIEKDIIPFVFSFKTLEDIIHILESTPFKEARWSVPDPGPQTADWLAALYYFIDKPEKSCEILDKAIEEAKFESFKQNLITLKQQIMQSMKS